MNHLKMKDVQFFFGGDIREVDILNKAMEGIDYVVSLVAMVIDLKFILELHLR